MMHEKLPDNINELISYAWVVFLAAWGGTVSYFNTLTKHNRKFNIWRFLIEVCTSAFVGVMTFLLCTSADLSWAITAAMVGVSGHMGTRALFVLEKRYEMYFGKRTENEDQS